MLYPLKNILKFYLHFKNNAIIFAAEFTNFINYHYNDEKERITV